MQSPGPCPGSVSEPPPGPTGGWSPRPNWARVRRNVSRWRQIGASEFIIRVLLFGVLEPPVRPFVKGQVLRGPRPSKEDTAFILNELDQGCKAGYYRTVSHAEAQATLADGNLISPVFVDRRGGKGRLIINLKRVSLHWDKKPMQMETLSGFCTSLTQGDHLLSFDLEGGYRHVRMHPLMEKYFYFHFAGQYYVCLTLPFGWGHSPYWFTQAMAPFVRYLREALCCRVLVYLDDFLLAAGVGDTPAGATDALELSGTVDTLLVELGLSRHPGKGVWGQGMTRLEHLGVVLDTQSMRFFITPSKLEHLQSLAKGLLQQVRSRATPGRVRKEALQHFLGKAISTLLPVPLARFYTRSLYNCLKGEVIQGCVRLDRTALWDLKTWRMLTAGDGRLMYAGQASWCMHTDAADMGYGATLGTDLTAGSPGELEAQEIWSPFRRLQSITCRELVAVRLALEQQGFQQRLLDRNPHTRQTVLVHIDNMAVVRILENMVSASPELMIELRALKKLLDKLKIIIRAQWLPSALNRHADRLSRVWNTRDLSVTTSLLTSIARSLQLQRVRRLWPLNEAPIARAKFIRQQFA